MEMAEYDEDEDFLKVQEQFFDERLDSLGPDLGKSEFKELRSLPLKLFQ